MKRIWLSLLGGHLFLFSLVAAARRWSPEAYPNPQEDPLKCGRRGVRSWVCDPDELITYESANVVEGILKKVYAGEPPYALGPCGSSGLRGYQIAVALMRRMNYAGDAGAAAGQFARSLHDRWGVGDPQCNNGVVLLISIEDRQIFISAGSGTTGLLTYDVLGDIVSDVRPALKDQRYNEAVERAVVDIGLALAGRPVEPEGGRKGAWWEELLGLGIFGSVVGGFIYLAARTESRKRRRYQDCKSKLDKLKRDQAAIRANTYNPTSCPVCLEDFSEAPAGAGSSSPTAAARADSAEVAPAGGSGAAGAVPVAGGGDVQMGPSPGGGGCGSCSDHTAAAAAAAAAKLPSAPSASSIFKASSTKEEAEAELRKPLMGQEDAAFPGGVPPSAPPLAPPLAASPEVPPLPPQPPSQPRRPLVLPCGHAFCEQCITQWLEQKKVTCPICRKPFDDDDGAPATDPRDTTAPRPPRPDPNRPDAGPSTGAGPSSYNSFGPRPPCSASFDDDEYVHPSYGGNTMYGGVGGGGSAVPRLRLRWGGRRRPVRMHEELLMAEMMFRLRQLQRQHPDYISSHMLQSWEQDLQNGREFSSQQLRQFQLNDPATRRELAYSGSSGTGVSFGGGSSRGGGGRGGSW